MGLAKKETPPVRYVLTFNADLCRWCRACELACSLHHEGVFRPATSRVRMLLDPFEAEMKAAMCRQCRKPFCLLACPENAMTVDERTGAPVILPDLCTGCGECADACPFNREGMVLRFDDAAGVYAKCDLCGGTPECVEACPTGALNYVQARAR